ncbi:MAG: tRNA lysidine(34) synthetase TilS, partial [Gammaproteobacteria bacterium]|nr:tRNA lysidine(34) synthetase TilS [Gammaproteobacteria bacterium]
MNTRNKQAPEWFRDSLATLSADRPLDAVAVAYSGGRDSTLLLQLLALAQPEFGYALRALHVDHGLHGESAAWADHCRAHCRTLGVAFEAFRLDGPPPVGNIEAWAREARYAQLVAGLAPGEFLMTAHHRGDQAETFLLQALRGAGVDGLAGMPIVRRCGAGWLARPLLAIPATRVEATARAMRLSWHDDPANFSGSFARSYLRHWIMPLVAERWPGADGALFRSAAVQAETARLVEELLQGPLAQARGPDNTLAVAVIRNMTEPVRRAVLRYWISDCSGRAPSQVRLHEIERQALEASAERAPAVDIEHGSVRRYRDALYWVPDLPDGEPPLLPALEWSPSEAALALPWGQLEGQPTLGSGLAAEVVEGAPLSVRLRRPGDRLRLRDGGPLRDMKQLFQELGVPPWERAWIPM